MDDRKISRHAAPLTKLRRDWFSGRGLSPLHLLQSTRQAFFSGRSIAVINSGFPPRKCRVISKAKTSASHRKMLIMCFRICSGHNSLLRKLGGDDSPGLLALVSNSMQGDTARNLHHPEAEATAYCAQSTSHAEAPGEVFLVHNFGSN
jgi:hypothetical protein